MSGNNLWGDALKNATPQQIMDFAAEAPKKLSNASTSDSYGVVRDAGLLLTKKQIIDLRKYESAGLALPHNLKDVEDYLRFGAGQDGGSGLRPADFLTTFQNTRNHARRWSPLRERIMMTGRGLKDFAISMLTYGASMKEVYSEVRASGLLDKHNVRNLAQLKALELEWGDRFPGIELESDTVSTLGYYLNRIFEKIDSNLRVVAGIKKDLDLFGYDLREHVLPDIKLRVGLIDSSSLSADIKQLKVIVDERSKEIDIKNTEYKAAVQEALKAAAGMNIVGLAMAIYMGVEAENIRVARERLYTEQERDIQLLASKNQTLGALARVKLDLQRLMIVAIDADVATQNLMHVWNVMHLCVKNSAAAVNQINDALSLRIFMTEFEEVVNPWKQIETDSDALIQVFKEADEEYERNYSLAPRAMKMVSLFSPAYPPLNLSALKSTHEQMRDARTQAHVWQVKLGYLPDLFDRFNRMVISVGQGANQLQSSALESGFELENTLRRLARNEKELRSETDRDVIEEIRAERQHLLNSATRAITEQTAQVRRCFNNINDPFDRRLTQAYILDFEREERLAKAEIVALQAKLAALGQERKVIVDAVQTLEQNGIEALGKDIEMTLGKVTELGLAPPEIKLVMMAIDQLKKTLIDAGNTIRFVDMLRESDKLQRKIETLANEIDREHAITQASIGKVTYLRAIHSTENLRQEYAVEYGAAVSAFEKFLAATAASKFADDDALSAAFKEQAALFITFLAPVSLPQR
ncbi:alpha-xenorhabdolysin family binary toxin subunit A [Pseudomonas sp. B21-053]|uniref:alpha-xenorhabdolysin family binary toxin subunit A n=1 Tax=Pseudomonas sp. B21-053 TaxID=2895493 RepID=UPI00222FEABA|nr:alpha-xenorhabdolysin family binary toxin subunit A [Pseudomonas sp. B21-053]UZE12861.1 alpha-xenorhabdolysin family binary toxin subunit A [Pseudomonas sp. B21-053]